MVLYANYEIIFTPGQYDVKLKFDVIDVNKSGIYFSIIKWLSEEGESDLYNKWYRDGLSYVDKIETIIERRKYRN